MVSKIRIITGIVLFVFVISHLINLAFGLASIEAIEAAKGYLMAPWQNPVGGPILIASFVAHASLGLWTLYQRNTLLMNWRDGSQALLGLAIIPLLLPHIMGVVVAPMISDVNIGYTWVMAVYWLFAPAFGIQQVIALIVIWVHGCYGLLLWLQVQERAGAMVGLAWPLVVAVPMLALLGFVEAGKHMFEMRENPNMMAEIRATAEVMEPLSFRLSQIHDTVIWIYLGVLALVLAARFIRIKGRTDLVKIHYQNHAAIQQKSGLSLLELARQAQIPHAGLCGARGRCGSCAVQICAGDGELSPADVRELEALQRTGAESGARLACQAIPQRGQVEVKRLYDPYILPGEYRALIKHQRYQTANPQPEETSDAPATEALPDEPGLTPATGEARS